MMATAVSEMRQVKPRTAVLASTDLSFRARVREALRGLRWEVTEAGGGAEALAQLEERPAEVMIVDSWLPDLAIQEFVAEFEALCPGTAVIAVDDPGQGGPRARTRCASVSPSTNDIT